MLIERFATHLVPRNLYVLVVVLGLMAASGCGSNDGGSSGESAAENSNDPDVIAYVKESGNDLGWYGLDPVSAKSGELVPAFGGELWPQVTNDGSRMATSDGDSPNHITIRDSAGTPVDGPDIYGDSFEWNPSGTLGAYNLGGFEGPFSVVDEVGYPADEWLATSAEDSSTGQMLDLASIDFESWITDEVLFVSVDGTAGIARMNGDVVSVNTEVDIDNPNYPVFDKQGLGVFVDEFGLRQIEVDDGTISDLAQLNPSPENDYIARQVSWSPVSSKFSYSAPASNEICEWTGSLSCWQVPLPPDFTSQGSNFSLDGETVAFQGYRDDADWHPYLVDLPSKEARPLPFRCDDTCYLYAFVASPGETPETDSVEPPSELADWVLEPDGIGPLLFGMNESEARAVVPELISTPGPFCDSWEVPGLTGVSLQVPPEGLRSIGILPDSVHGPAGIRPGSKVSELKSQLGSELIHRPVETGSLGYDFYYLDSASGETTIQFVVDKSEGEVLFVQAGYPGEFYYPNGSEMCA